MFIVPYGDKVVAGSDGKNLKVFTVFCDDYIFPGAGTNGLLPAGGAFKRHAGYLNSIKRRQKSLRGD